MTEILVVIVNFRTASLAEKCLEAVARERAAGVNLSAILVDGCSDDGSVPQLQAFLSASDMADWTELLALDFNGGFGWANNQAILHRGDRLPRYIYLLNPDAEIEPGAIAALARILDTQTEVAAVGSQLIETDGSRAASAFHFPSLGTEFVRGAQTSGLNRLLKLKALVIEPERAGSVDWVTGASVMLRKEALCQTGLFDDGFFLYFEEVELMHRLYRSGWQTWSEPKSIVTHIGGASTGVKESRVPRARPDYWYRSRQRYFALTKGRLYAFATNLAWFAGYLLVRLPRLLLSQKFRQRAVPGEFQGIRIAGLWCRDAECRQSAPSVAGPSRQMPYWVRNQDG